MLFSLCPIRKKVKPRGLGFEQYFVREIIVLEYIYTSEGVGPTGLA